MSRGVLTDTTMHVPTGFDLFSAANALRKFFLLAIIFMKNFFYSAKYVSI
jgi:hypothetical protein